MSNSAPAWLTGEVALYALILLLALGLRLGFLDHYPLSITEATQGLAAYNLLNAQADDPGFFSPLLLSLNSLFMFLFGAADVTARLGSVVLGLGVVLLPLGLRRQLGPTGVLLASFMLATSAGMVFWSRTNQGDIAAVLGLGLLLLALVRWVETRATSSLFWLGLSLVLLLLSVPPAVTALLAAGIVLLLLWVVDREVFIETGRSMGQHEQGRQAAGISLFLFLVLGTTAFFNVSGLAVISDMFNVWLSQFAPPGDGVPRYPALALLLFYEPLPLIFGPIGVVWAFFSRDRFDWVLGMFIALVILLDVFMPGRSHGQMLLPLLPLILLAARIGTMVIAELQSRAVWESDGLFVGVVAVVVVFVYITLTAWTRCVPGLAGCETAWVLPVAGLALIVGLSIIFMAWYGWSMMLRGLAAVLFVSLILLSLGQSWRLNFATLSDLHLQPMLLQAPSPRLPLLLTDLERLSYAETGDARSLDLAVVDLDLPVTRWYLRDYTGVRFEPTFTPFTATKAVLARPDTGQPPGDYLGQDFALVSAWSPLSLDRKTALRWYLFRQLNTQTYRTDQVILWVRQDIN